MLKDFTKYSLFSMVNVIVGYLLLIVLSNSMNKANYADFGVYSAIASISLIFINLGYRDAIFKFSSQNHTQLTTIALSGSRFLALATLPVIALVGFFYSGILAIAVLSVVCVQQVHIMAAYLRGKSDYTSDALSIPFYRLLWLLALVGMLWLDLEIEAYSVFFVSLSSAILTWILIGGFKGNSFSDIRFHNFLLSIKDGTILQFFLIELVTVLFMRFDMLLLKLTDTPSEELASYFFSLQIHEAATFLVVPLAYIFFNRYNMSNHRRVTEIVLGTSLLLISCCCLGISLWWLIGKELLEVIFPLYTESFDLILLLLFAVVPNGFNAVLSFMLFAKNREMTFVYVSGVGTIVLAVSNYLLVPVWGEYGTASARLIAETSIFVLLLLSLLLRKNKE